jgi:hypothetical protein
MFNRHLWDIPFDIYPLQRYYVLAIYVLFSLSSGLVKMSVLLFYKRLSSRAVSPAYRWTLRITIGLIGVYTCEFYKPLVIWALLTSSSNIHVRHNLHV